MSPSRCILLVGEGNFSFSASLCKSQAGSSVTATCLQHPEEALRHEGVAGNIQAIKDSGGTVLFEVDCTKLGECASLQGRVFDRVVFNFPHCGRKSGVKKNRELLKNFFLSCVQVLAEDGEVHVSLCNGQGGTPADQPKREWHNSWQVATMAAEAHLILSAVRPFESENLQNYKCTGYRSQDKGFHVEKALLHVFTRSLPYTPAHVVQVEEVVRGEKVLYSMPAELSDYVFRRFLSSDSVHPVKLVQNFLLEGLEEKWPVSLATESVSFLIAAKRQLTFCCGTHSSKCYLIRLLQRDLFTSEADRALGHKPETPPASVASDKVDGIRCKGDERLRRACFFDVDAELESGLYVLRPSLLPQMKEPPTNEEATADSAGPRDESEESSRSAEVEGKASDEACGDSNGVTGSLSGVSGVVFRNLPVSLWAPPASHELLLRGVFPSERETIKLLGRKLETLLAPYGVSIVTEDEGLHLTAQPMGSVGKVFADNTSDNSSYVSISISLNLDLLAVLLYSLPDWRLLWSRDQRFLRQFLPRPPPGTPFRPFSLFPEPFSFDISLWTGPEWDEKKFHAAVREASRGTVEHVKLIDTFSHPDLSQTSYCYRLVYHSHTHALSHKHALKFHKRLESLLSSRLQVIIR
ncbi:ferredoxin-fold anticodon-binding domain-containing protein 1 [Odontesthes bonariensis]|uniref:ferredoxin-fold anticodon-binding domain-containing protein 1 n=1 Tax=Odontesthes bonariensis TaxID=219752 RepID=UPI003F58FE52